jgi:hypothetical protein
MNDNHIADEPHESTLREAVDLTIKTLERQLDLIAERAPGKYLDKTPIVRSLKQHWARLTNATLREPRADADTAGACVHADDPKACYRVRCQLGNKCVDDDMSFRKSHAAGASNERADAAPKPSDKP